MKIFKSATTDDETHMADRAAAAEIARRATAAQCVLVGDLARQVAWSGYQFANVEVRDQSMKVKHRIF